MIAPIIITIYYFNISINIALFGKNIAQFNHPAVRNHLIPFLLHWAHFLENFSFIAFAPGSRPIFSQKYRVYQNYKAQKIQAVLKLVQSISRQFTLAIDSLFMVHIVTFSCQY